MIAAAFLVLLRPYSIQCALFLLLLLLGTIATIVFFCCWHRKLQKGRHPMKSVFSGRSRSRGRTSRDGFFGLGGTFKPIWRAKRSSLASVLPPLPPSLPTPQPSMWIYFTPLALFIPSLGSSNLSGLDNHHGDAEGREGGKDASSYCQFAEALRVIRAESGLRQSSLHPSHAGA
ncbi:hypothetical protein TREES_T100015985 [Tupaia chinensis]|uniref:Dystonin n=1 Tax=Tupaia chinensis TaxID=246437 RepID=L9KSV7_TUPCH|nr:hypothetical protein TREES_T100015985 [Tupaia chinensis]